MHSKLYTAVIQKSGKTRVVNIDTLSNQDRAINDVNKEYPGYTLLALIPGCHAKWSHVFENAEPSHVNHMRVDVWDTSGMPN